MNDRAEFEPATRRLAGGGGGGGKKNPFYRGRAGLQARGPGLLIRPLAPRSFDRGDGRSGLIGGAVEHPDDRRHRRAWQCRRPGKRVMRRRLRLRQLRLDLRGCTVVWVKLQATPDRADRRQGVVVITTADGDRQNVQRDHRQYALGTSRCRDRRQPAPAHSRSRPITSSCSARAARRAATVISRAASVRSGRPAPWPDQARGGAARRRAVAIAD